MYPHLQPPFDTLSTAAAERPRRCTKDYPCCSPAPAHPQQQQRRLHSAAAGPLPPSLPPHGVPEVRLRCGRGHSRAGGYRTRSVPPSTPFLQRSGKTFAPAFRRDGTVESGFWIDYSSRMCPASIGSLTSPIRREEDHRHLSPRGCHGPAHPL